MAADELHGWVALGGLLPEDGAGEHRVVPALLPQVDFNLQLQTRCQSKSRLWRRDRPWKVDTQLNQRTHGQLVFVRPDPAALSLFYHLLDVHQHRQCHAAWCKTVTKKWNNGKITFGGISCRRVGGESWLKQPMTTFYITCKEQKRCCCSVLQLFLPNAEWGLYWEAQQSAGVPGEDVADLSPLIRLQQAAVRRVLNAVAQVHQAAHEDLNICTKGWHALVWDNSAEL